MNTKPDDTQILLWLDDELDPQTSAATETWVSAHMPSHFAQRAQLRAWKTTLGEVMPDSQEMPYPDFFQHRVMRAINDRATLASTTPVLVEKNQQAPRKWLLASLAVAACAVVSFMGGRLSQPSTTPLIIYTPEEGVKAEFFVSSPADATVIVLNGVKPLPDSLIDKETAKTHNPTDQDAEQTANTLAP